METLQVFRGYIWHVLQTSMEVSDRCSLQYNNDRTVYVSKKNVFFIYSCAYSGIVSLYILSWVLGAIERLAVWCSSVLDCGCFCNVYSSQQEHDSNLTSFAV